MLIWRAIRPLGLFLKVTVYMVLWSYRLAGSAKLRLVVALATDRRPFLIA